MDWYSCRSCSFLKLTLQGGRISDEATEVAYVSTVLRMFFRVFFYYTFFVYFGFGVGLVGTPFLC